MRNFDLNACGVQEMNAVEMKQTNGGDKVEYIWVNTNNGLVYFGVACANAGIWGWNLFQ